VLGLHQAVVAEPGPQDLPVAVASMPRRNTSNARETSP
jgi:hypothetical protein